MSVFNIGIKDEERPEFLDQLTYYKTNLPFFNEANNIWIMDIL